MNELITKIMEANIEYELNRFKQTIEEDISASFDWIKALKLKDIVSPDQIMGLIQRNVIELPIAGSISELAVEMSNKVLLSPQNKETSLEDIFAHKQFDDIVNKAVSLKNARNKLIQHFLSTSVYSKLISHVVYTGIKDFLLTENVIAKNVPGVSFFMNMGRKAVNNLIPSLEPAIDNNIQNHIGKNIENMIKNSEKFLTEFMNEKQILEMGDEIWKSIGKNHLYEYFSTIDVNDMEDFLNIGFDFWLHFRKTRYFNEIYKELVCYFFDKYGDKSIEVIINEFGFSKEILINELLKLINPVIKKAVESGYIEERIRTRLTSFYLSDYLSEKVN